jgi:purine-binding chemotaxis protein CheW
MTPPGSALARVERSPAEIERILRQRAARLAAPLAPATPAATSALVVFRLAGERYGLHATQVVSVAPLRDLTPVPCTPPVVLGVINHHGRILPVLDLRPLLALAAVAPTEGSRVVVVDTSTTRVGLLAESLDGIVSVPRDSLTAPSAPAQTAGSLVRAVTPDMVAVLDTEALRRDARLFVDDEVD